MVLAQTVVFTAACEKKVSRRFQYDLRKLLVLDLLQPDSADVPQKL